MWAVCLFRSLPFALAFLLPLAPDKSKKSEMWNVERTVKKKEKVQILMSPSTQDSQAEWAPSQVLPMSGSTQLHHTPKNKVDSL